MVRSAVDVVRDFQPPLAIDLVKFFRRDGEPAAVQSLVDRFARYLTDDFICEFSAISKGQRRGAAGLRDIWLDWLAPWDSYRVAEHEFIEVGDDRVLVVVRDFGRREGSGEVALQGTALYTVRDGKIARAQYFAQRAEGYAAAGVEPPG